MLDPATGVASRMAMTSTASVEKPSRIAISEILIMKNAPLVLFLVRSYRRNHPTVTPELCLTLRRLHSALTVCQTVE
jgi:hypothetical protein